MARKRYELLGKKYYSLTVQEELKLRKSGSRVWKCQCDCGKYHEVTTHDLVSGRVKSCGCRPTRKAVDLTGKRYGKLLVCELTEERKSNGSAVWKCRCDCGQEVYVSSGNLNRGNTTSCGCVRREDLTGKRFGKLVVWKLGQKSGKGEGAFWICKCDCGNQCEVQAAKLKSGHTKSCGCSHSDQIRDITGKRFGKLLVLRDSGERRSGSGGVLWRCRCDCGKEKNIRQDALLVGATTSCGCTISRGNEKVSRLLRDAGISFVQEYSPHDMDGKKRFDFAVINNGKVDYFIEYDGILHSKYSNKGWDTAERYQRTVESDQKKNEYCLRKQIPLIRIPYTKFESLLVEDLLLDTSRFLVKQI